MPSVKTILENPLTISSLVELDLSYQDIKLENLKELINVLAANTTLTILNLSGNHFGNPGFQLLINSLPNISTLILRDCNITTLDSSPTISNLQNLDLANNRVDNKGVEQLVIIKLLTLSLAGNQCEDAVAITLAKSDSLISLTLSHNKIMSDGCQALSENSSIKTLNLNYNFIYTKGVIYLANNKIIESLSVAGNSIDENGILALAYNNHSITFLDLSYNFVNDAGFGALGSNINLKHLDVGFNQITYKGAKLFVENNISLSALIICHNLLGDAGAVIILKHATIVKLDLSGNSIGFAGGRAAFQNTVLTSLAISSNMLGETGGIMLAQSATLKELYISYNEIGDDAAAIFTDNKTLETLNLNYNSITEKGRQLLTNNKAIKNLILSEEQPPEFTSENLVTMFLLAESFQCISDIDGTIQFFNPAFSRVLGYRTDELLSKSAYDFLHPADFAAEKKRDEDKSLVHNYQNRYRCSDGTYRTFHWRSQLKNNRRYADGHDVTERLFDHQESLVTLKKHSDNLLQESRDNIERQTIFMAHLSHEIRNPLSGITGLLDICIQQIVVLEKLISQLSGSLSPSHKLRLNSAIEEIKDNLKSMIICADYQLLILNTNLAIIKITDKNFKLDTIIFDLKKTLSEVTPMLAMQATLKGITISISTPDVKEIWVKGDSLRLKQIIMNLLGNAIKFTDKGTISLSLNILENNDDITKIQIIVKDSGIGLTTAEQAVLFGRWIQANHSIESQYGGSGLGLHLAKQIAIAMHGNITVVSEIGNGSTFSVTADLNTLSKDERDELETKEEARNTLSPLVIPTGAFGLLAVKPRQKLTVLVVDDNLINRKVLIRILVTAGHECVEAVDGVEAVEIFSSNKRINLILMDIQMPRKNGLEATSEIRAIEKKLDLNLHIPIFAITANAQEFDIKNSNEAGMDGHFIKPVDKIAMLASIDSLIIVRLPDIPISRSTTAPNVRC